MSNNILAALGMVPSIIDVWGYDREFCSSYHLLLLIQPVYNNSKTEKEKQVQTLGELRMHDTKIDGLGYLASPYQTLRELLAGDHK